MRQVQTARGATPKQLGVHSILLLGPSSRLAVGLAQFLEWLSDSDRSREIAAWRHLEASPPSFAEWPAGIAPELLGLLRRRGIVRPYTHQTSAIEAVLAGRNVVVVTPTASGKTLCYNLPILSRILADGETRALYVFPTKALAQDQLAELRSLVDGLGSDISTHTYDGDTPSTARRAIRLAGQIVVTNPDMLHTGVLPHHTRWHRLFQSLRYVVIDEMHTYRGVFGSHVANVIRRLKRICRHYGSEPQFILCSATIANPRDLAEKLVEENVDLVDRSGAPTPEKHFVIFNPPVVNRQLGIRASSVLTARRLVARLLAERVRTIIFVRSRLLVEVLLTYLREDGERSHLPVESIRGYRGGYLPLERREIERGLRDGSIYGVVSTSALELGIDIGGLDSCIMVGYPGTIAGTWQRAGRAGRRTGASLAMLVASSNPLDQFIANHPDYFFDTSVESGLVDPDNLYVLVSHIKCAAFELSFEDGEAFAREGTTDVLGYLADERVLHRSGSRWYWSSESFPAESISLRTATTDNVVIIDQTQAGRPVVIGEMDRLGAATMLHDEAIYIHGGRQYEVLKLDWEEKKAYVRQANVDYYTDADLAIRLQVLNCFAEATAGTSIKAWGEVNVTTVATIFKKIRLETHENVGWGKIFLPEDSVHTTGYWLSIGPNLANSLTDQDLQSSLLGLGHVLGNIAPLYLMSDPGDLGVFPEVRSPFTGAPTIYIYDRIPGGVGFAEKLYEIHLDLLRAAEELIRGCRCEDGCPSCVGVPQQVGERGKIVTLTLVAGLLKESPQ